MQLISRSRAALGAGAVSFVNPPPPPNNMSWPLTYKQCTSSFYSGIPLRAREFDWQKPGGGAGAVSFTSPQQQLVRMDDLLQQKDRELGIVRSQLFKAQEENYRLIQVLQG